MDTYKDQQMRLFQAISGSEDGAMKVVNLLVAKILADELPRFTLEELRPLVENECMKILCEIQAVIADATLDDEKCFEKIESIVCILENRHIDCGGRHDFG